MVTNGSDVYRRMSLQMADAERAAAAAAAQLRQLQEARAQLGRDEAQALAALARVRLGELDGERIAEGLDHADREALALLERRDLARAALDQDIARTTATLTSLAERRARRLQERDAAAALLEELRAATMRRLQQDEDYLLQQGHVEHLTLLAGRATAKAEQAEADRETKRAPYEADKLFAYLWRRGYRRQDYRPLPLFRTLDAWVARLCDYDRARRDYAMLLEIPVRLRAHADAAAARASAATADLQQLEDAALAADGAPALAARLEQTRQALAAASAELDATEDTHEALLVQLHEIDEGRDAASSQALAAVASQLMQEDVETLRREAQATLATDADDRHVQSIAEIRRRRQEIDRDIAPVQADLQHRQKVVAELQELRRRFRQQGFDAERSVFEGGFDLGSLLGGILQGTLQAGSAWTRMRRHQRHRGPAAAMTGARIAGSILGSMMSSGSRSRGGGGFRSGGGFGGGGGGFRTGGGF